MKTQIEGTSCDRGFSLWRVWFWNAETLAYGEWGSYSNYKEAAKAQRECKKNEALCLEYLQNAEREAA